MSLFKTSEKMNRIAGIVIAVLAGLFLAGIIYLNVAHATQIWPF